VSTAGSHTPNTAIAQAYYNNQEGTRRIAPETGAGQWGSARAGRRLGRPPDRTFVPGLPADHLRRMGPFEPHRIGLDELEYTTMPELMDRLRGRWEPDEVAEVATPAKA